jgi:hypothetical protein
MAILGLACPDLAANHRLNSTATSLMYTSLIATFLMATSLKVCFLMATSLTVAFLMVTF